ncbi:MAG: PD40 domain-containing protein [Candidatus Marinimicrobia bacterium]|nr:PD40 domain-containing protein [Candidatus Neomarinimicrobiota bacterium]
MKRIFGYFIVVLFVGFSFGQIQYNHPELNWHSFETEHFMIHFHDETERTAREGAFVAETVYPHVTALYDHEPDEKTHLIFIDTDDFSNGAAYYYDNKIFIWASPLDYALRGSHRWLQNVITHEFVHIVSIQKAMKAGRKIPGAYLQFMGYEEYKRKDVLYGFPNKLVSYPVPGAIVPPWLAEGISQYMYDGADWDNWDTHRDMILRDRVLNDNLLTLTEMNTFGKKGIGNESTYNSGYALSRYIGVKYGSDSFRRIMEEMAKPTQYSINSAIKKAINIPASKLYQDFKMTLESRYDFLTESVTENNVSGNILISDGTTNIYPTWHPDGKSFAYLSNKRNDYFGQTELYIYNLADGSEERIASGVNSAASWHPDGKHIFYSSRPVRPNKVGSNYFDIFVYNIETEKEERLTVGSRGYAPVYIHEDSLIAYLSTYDGSQNIHMLDLKDGQRYQLTEFDDHRMIHSVAYDEKNHQLLFDYTNHHFRNIGYYSISDTVVGDLIAEPMWDERDISISNGSIYYSDDRSGIFNLYTINATDGSQGYLTNVLGGAFMPDISTDGKILYSQYDNGQYNIAILDTVKVLHEEYVGYSPSYYLRNNNLKPPLVTQDTTVATTYHDQFAKMFIMPKVMLDYGTIKPGFYFYQSEVINRLNLFGGVSANSINDLDLFFIFEFNRFYPTLFLETFYITRNIQENSSYSDTYVLDDRIRYRLTYFRGGLRFPILGVHTLEISSAWQVYRAFIDQSIPSEKINAGFAYDYYRGWVSSLHWHTNAIKSRLDSDIVPSKGFEVDATLNYEKNDFIEGLNLSDAGTIVPDFSKANDLLRFEGNGEYHWEIPKTNRWTFSFDAIAGWMNNTEADSFFNFFGGGLTGLKGYPYYSIEGNRLAIGSFTFRVPIFREKHIQLGWFTLQNSVMGFIAQGGDAWSDSFDLKPSLGFQWRFNGFSFYNFPTAIGLEVHQGQAKVTNTVNDKVYTYGKDNRFYFTLLFGF